MNPELLMPAIIAAGLVVGLVAAALLFRGAVSKAISDGVARSMLQVEEQRQCEAVKVATAKLDSERRLARNPWNKRGDNWNMTVQIERMRDDFDAAEHEAAEAGVDISHLRGHVDANDLHTVVLGSERQDPTDSRCEGHMESPNGINNAPKSYFPCFSDPKASKRADRSVKKPRVGRARRSGLARRRRAA